MLRKLQSYKVGSIVPALHMKTLVLRGANKMAQNPRANSMGDFHYLARAKECDHRTV